MILSQRIAQLIEEMLEESNGILEIGRNELALKMGCVPSQINYVITSRFTPDKGYIVESRRGGGGFIRIKKISYEKNSYLLHFYNAIGNSIDFESAKVFTLHLLQNDIITKREAELILAPLTEQALGDVERERRPVVRASLFKAIILRLAAI